MGSPALSLVASREIAAWMLMHPGFTITRRAGFVELADGDEILSAGLVVLDRMTPR